MNKELEKGNSMTTFIVEQKIAPLANQYRVFGLQNDTRQLIAFAQQKRFTMKEQVLLYTDESKSSQAFRIAAEKVMDIHGKFFVKNPADETIGVLRKSFKSSLLRSTYELMDANESVVAIVQERSINIAVLRRVWGFIPFIGDLPFIFKYHFDFVDPKTQTLLAKYDKTTRFRDHYMLHVIDDNLLSTVGWQTLIAQAVMLDVMQGR